MECSPLNAVFAFCSFKVDGELRYLQDAKQLENPERNTVTISFLDVEEYNTKLATLIQERYYQ